jgi:hypothetical protein
MSTTAGSLPLAVGAFVTVAAMLKPLAGTRTVSSPSTEKADMREAAEATSSRAISRVCDGTLSRTKLPPASVHRLTASSPFGFRKVSEKRFEVKVRCGVSIRSSATAVTTMGISACGAM